MPADIFAVVVRRPMPDADWRETAQGLVFDAGDFLIELRTSDSVPWAAGTVVGLVAACRPALRVDTVSDAVSLWADYSGNEVAPDRSAVLGARDRLASRDGVPPYVVLRPGSPEDVDEVLGDLPFVFCVDASPASGSHFVDAVSLIGDRLSKRKPDGPTQRPLWASPPEQRESQALLRRAFANDERFGEVMERSVERTGLGVSVHDWAIARMMDDLEGVWPAEEVVMWLRARVSHLGGARPIDVLAYEGVAPVHAAVDQLVAGAFA